ncbi:MAG: hypothetical protein EOO26_12690 [Comamonadaceae bacterium]|nr:MAG: hypothetical protein EOO26_12690 [Comamonadaceae bacterium]
MLIALSIPLLGATAGAQSTEPLKEEPANLSLRKGQVVYVDDGKCPAGEIKRITGGNQAAGVKRQVECVKRPEGR